MTTSSVNPTETSGYAVYIYNINKYHISSATQNLNTTEKSLDSDQSNVCLSLLGSNLDAEQETLVRCYLLKTFSVSESLSFQNEGRFVQIKYNENVKDTFGCYYHHLEHDPSENYSSQVTEAHTPKKLSYFICLTGQNSEVMNSFCSELSVFCNLLLPNLDPEEHINLEEKLKKWYFYCIEYIVRCIGTFRCSLVLLFQSALNPKIDVECENEGIRWDLERFIDACSLTSLFQVNTEQVKLSPSKIEPNDNEIHLKVKDNIVTCKQNLDNSAYCQKWVDELLMCDLIDSIKLRNVLEMFRLKTVRDVNTMKRLLKKAENDYYSLFKAYQFYKLCGYGDVLLRHVKEEAILTSHEEALDVIKSLCDYIARGPLNI